MIAGSFKGILQRNYVPRTRSPIRFMGGLRSFAMRMGCVAVPLVKKNYVPVAKEFGRNLVSTFVPEIPKIVAEKKQPRKALNESLKLSVKKTVKTSGRSNPLP